jgi:hypothetical protein
VLTLNLEDIILLSVPFQMAVKNCFIRGSVVRYVQLPAEHVDTQLLEDATRRRELRYNLRDKRNNEMSDYRSIANRSCDTSQAVTIVNPRSCFGPYYSVSRTGLPRWCCHNIRLLQTYIMIQKLDNAKP